MHILPSLLFHLYAIDRFRIRHIIKKILRRTERGELYSPTLRRIFRHYHDVDIGLYMSGCAFEPFVLDRHTTVGRYCSIARGVQVNNRNHPMELKSTHAFFFNPKLGGLVKDDTIAYTPLEIGHDVWIGAQALIHPSVESIGTGAVVGMGAVVSKNVPPYAVVVGNPARVVRYRFAPDVIEELLASRWWDKSIEELGTDEFTTPLVGTGSASDGEIASKKLTN